MENAMTLIKGRRSTRKFLDKPIPQELLEQVLEAGRYAPSGKNVQATHFLVIENRAVLDRLAVLVREAFQEAGVKRPEGYIFHYDHINGQRITSAYIQKRAKLFFCELPALQL